MEKKKTVRIVANAVLAVAVFTVWILSFFLWRGEALSVNGWADLKYFTVESNLLVGVVAVIWLVFALIGKETPRWLSILKYISATAVFVTFTVVVVFLGPLYGYGRMYYGANLFFHLLIPLFAIAEEAVFGEDVSFKESFFACVPPAVYGIGYVTNCLVNGIGSWDTVRNDWYSFLEWGYGVGALIFVLICAIAWGLGLAVRALMRPARKIPWDGRE